jgi:hypothetical protein
MLKNNTKKKVALKKTKIKKKKKQTYLECVCTSEWQCYMSAQLLIVFNFPKGCSEGQGTLEVDVGGVSNSNLIRLMELAGYILHILSCCLSHQPFCNKDPSQSSCRELPFTDRWTDGYQSAGLRWSGGNSRNFLLWV